MRKIFDFFRKKNENKLNIPKVGRKIRITHLPFNNARPTRNCYIGSEGMVEEADDYGFTLRFENGGILIVSNSKMKFEYV